MKRTVRLRATVARCGHNRRLVSVRMESAEPHILRFIGDGGQAMFGAEIPAMLQELMLYGYEFTVQTEFSEVSMMEVLSC